MSWFAPKRASALALPEVPPSATFIEEGCQLAGQLQFQNGVRIDGQIEGEVRARGTVIVGETGAVDASIFADVVVVLGEVQGDISATTLVALHKGARVRSDITTAGIVVEPGSNFRGSIVIGPEEAPALAEGAGPDPDTTLEVADDGRLVFEEEVEPIAKIAAEGLR